MALEAGFTRVDTAQLYHNEKNVSETILDYAAHPQANQIFITSKLYQRGDHNQTYARVKKTITNFGGLRFNRNE